MKRLLLLILGVALFVGSLWLGWTFRAANALSIDLDLIWLRVPNLELWWLLVLATGFGALLATLVVGFAWLRLRVLNRRFRKTIKRLESELHQMRSLPLSSTELPLSSTELPLSSSDEEGLAEESGRIAEGRA